MGRILPSAVVMVAALAGGACRGASDAQAQATPTSDTNAASWTVDFPTSGSQPAQQHFIRGLTAMHLFMYPDAVKAFRAAQDADPTFAMAYWGEALTHYRPIWREYEREDGRAVLQRLGATPEARAAAAPTDREKAYLHTLEILYADGEPAGRLRAYAGALEALAQRFPQDDEALALWALSRVVQYARTEAEMQERMRTASIAQEVLRRSPRHPGALRYLIQSVDDPVHADLGTIAAQAFVDAKPDSSEARHMPTHISAQLGRWTEMAELNWQAFEISMDWTTRNGYRLQDLNNHNYGHLLTYAQYGYLQLGQYRRARQIIERARDDFHASGKAAEIASTFAATLAQYVIETSDQEHAAALRDLLDSGAVAGANLHYAIGLASARSGDLARARAALPRLAGTTVNARIMRAEVTAAIALAERNTAKAVAIMADAAAADLAQIYTHFGPPGPYQPAHELYGEVLLAARRPGDALQAFQEGLRIYRGRTALLRGAMRAADAAGDPALAATYAARLRDIWRSADQGLPALAELQRTTE